MNVKMRCFTYFVLLSTLLGCRAKRDAMLESENIVVIPAIYIQSHASPSEFETDTNGVEFWTPSPEDVRRVDRHLTQELQRRKKMALKSGGAPRPVSELAQWQGTSAPVRDARIWDTLIESLKVNRRQYVGFTKGTKRMIPVNCLPPGPHRDWRNKYISVSDGGESYWHIDYDIGSDSYENVIVNPSA
jgi:hypothetical protein